VVSAVSERVLFDPIPDLGEGCAGTLFVESAAVSAARSDRGSAGHDSHPADRIGDIGQGVCAP